jgi:uncharacterized membrane protein YphA (DoxX/SURF4 family)
LIKNMMQLIRLFSQYLLGLLFIFSGFVKAIDPWGSAYKFSDYFHAFGFSFLDAISLPLAIFLAAFEFVLGSVLILGLQKRRTYWLLLIFMCFFTLLTFIIALTNPVTDCGCFGDALILTNWQTFFKNLLFMVFVLILFNSRRRTENTYRNQFEGIIIIILFAGSFALSLNSIRHLPPLDFRPYKVGTYIPAAMEIPEDAPRDEYLTVLYYRNTKTGITEEFSIDDYPRDTVNYQFVTSESRLIKKGYEPIIHDFAVLNPQGFDVTDEILSFNGYTLLMISHDLKKADRLALTDGNNWSKLERFAGDFKFIPVTASMSGTIDEVSVDAGLDYKFYSGDEIMLKTIIRSDPGFMIIKNGTIIAKWGYRDFPAFTDWDDKWGEVLQQYTENADPEIMMLIEEGLMEALQLEIIEFDRTANMIIAQKITARSDQQVIALAILIILLVLILPRLIISGKSRGRV